MQTSGAGTECSRHKKQNNREQCPQTVGSAVIPLNEENGRSESRRLVGKNRGIQNFLGIFSAVSPRLFTT